MHLSLIGSISSHLFSISLLKVLSLQSNLTKGTIGQKTGFTETLDTQVKKILNMTATALRRVALSKKPKAEKGQPRIRDEEFLEVPLPLYMPLTHSKTPNTVPSWSW